jgi:hypothetical protein
MIWGEAGPNCADTGGGAVMEKITWGLLSFQIDNSLNDVGVGDQSCVALDLELKTLLFVPAEQRLA